MHRCCTFPFALAGLFLLIKVRQQLLTIVLNSICMNLCLLYWKGQGKVREFCLFWKVVIMLIMCGDFVDIYCSQTWASSPAYDDSSLVTLAHSYSR